MSLLSELLNCSHIKNILRTKYGVSPIVDILHCGHMISFYLFNFFLNFFESNEAEVIKHKEGEAQKETQRATDL